MESKRGNCYLVGAKDLGTSFRLLIPTPGVTAEDAVYALTCMLQWGIVPEVVMTDNGPQFACGRFIQFLESLGIEWRSCMPNVHEQNGFVERAWRDWNKAIGEPNDRWDEYSPVFSRLCNQVQSNAYGGYSAVALTTGFGLPPGKSVEDVRKEVLAKRVEELKEVEAAFPVFVVGELADLRVTKKSKRQFGAMVVIVKDVRKGGRVLEVVGKGVSATVHVRQLVKIPMAPVWWADEAERTLCGSEDISQRLHVETVFSEWVPEGGEIAIQVGDFLHYVDGGAVFVGKVLDVHGESVTVQDTRVERRLTGKGRKRVKVLFVLPLSYDADGVICTAKGKQPVSYKVDRGQVLQVVEVVRKGRNLVLGEKFGHSKLVVDNVR
jgi:hypothetical protein